MGPMHLTIRRREDDTMALPVERTVKVIREAQRSDQASFGGDDVRQELLMRPQELALVEFACLSKMRLHTLKKGMTAGSISLRCGRDRIDFARSGHALDRCSERLVLRPSQLIARQRRW